MVLRKPIIFKAARMVAKYFLKHRLPFLYDPIFGNKSDKVKDCKSEIWARF
jgi:hypothetical protein